MPLVPINAPPDTIDHRQDPLRYMESHFRVLAALIDAMVADWDWQEWRVLGHVETAILRERPPGEREGWNLTHGQRAMAEWGAVDQDGIYRAAGLTNTQTRVAKLYFDRQFTPREIAHLLDIAAPTVRVHLHDVHQRLKRLGQPQSIAA